MEKNQKGDENMEKMMTQMELLTKHVMGSGDKAMNVVGTNSEMSSDDAYFEAIYNKEVQFLSSQAVGSRPFYPRLGGNQGWNRDRADGWRDLD
ncbi:hypothetical protein MTR67_023287 [Solanum verrucosum]|uniref:Uncharacterized protein n=1 Tax=Solanum verrucosum TaxID=315347 RepID=A0AAF0TR89_SOLVR|nr:hypothetical protein MTR67_023287 [Solanum verrucosum]